MQSQPCSSATAVSHGEGSPRTSPLANADVAVPAGSLVISASPQQRALIDLLPNEILLHIVDHLDSPSRRALGSVGRRARAVLTPHRRFDRLHASIRWAGSIGQLTELLGRIASEPVPQRGALLGSVIERIQHSGRIPSPVLAQLVDQLEGLPVAKRPTLLAALAEASGRRRGDDPEVEGRMLTLARRLPDGIRGQALGQCLISLRPAVSRADLQGWIAMAGALPQEGAGRLLEAVVEVAASQQQLDEEMVGSVLERVRAMRASDGMPAPCQGWVLQKLVDKLDSMVGNPFAAKSRLAAWDAVLDTAWAALGSGDWPLPIVSALHAWLHGPDVSAIDRASRAGRLSHLNAGLKADALLVLVGSRTPRDAMYQAWSNDMLRAANHGLGQVAGFDAATQAKLYAGHPHLFVTSLADDVRERELFLRGLNQIEALNPVSLRVEPLAAWSDALRTSEDVQAWIAFSGAVRALPVEDRATVLLRTIKSSHSKIGFSFILPQAEALPPALGAPILGQLAVHLLGEPASEQVRRAEALTAIAGKWPPADCTELVLKSMSTLEFVCEDAAQVVRRGAADMLTRLSLADRARVLRDLAVLGGPASKGWVLEQLPALADAQQQLAIPGEPMLPYRAEIVRRMIVAIGSRDAPTAIQFGMLWPSLREALDGVEPEARGPAIAALRRILTRVSGSLRDEVEHALATRWAADLPAQPQWLASAEIS